MVDAKNKQISNNSTLPVTISSIRLITTDAQHTRRSFLDGLFKPILSANRDRPYTLAEAIQEAGNAAEKLRRFGTCHYLLWKNIGKGTNTI
jgi:outer membrane protein insertion porin family